MAPDATSGVRVKLVIVTLRNQVVFPHLRSSFEVTKRSLEQAQALIDQKKADGLGAIALRPSQGREAVPFEVGTQYNVLNVETKQDKNMDNEVSQMLMDRASVVVSVEGGARFKVLDTEIIGQVEVANVEFLEDTDDEKDLTVRALVQSVQEKIAELAPKNSPEHAIFRRGRHLGLPNTAVMLTSFVGATLAPLTLEERQQILETVGLKQRLELVLDFLQRESQALRVSTQISESIQRSRDQEMRHMALQRQAQEIQRELQRLQQKKDKFEDEGHSSEEEEEDELAHLGEKLSKANLPEDAKRIAKKELKRLKSLQAHHPEYTSTHSYLELLASLPWNNQTKESFDLQEARRLLDEDHRGLEKVKIRILEFLAVQKLRGNMKGPILCLHGPPGIGKTSLGRSIAKAIGRKFHRIALGGVRDEAELRGHRRTYIGSIPGVIIQAFQSLGVNNPVILLDEVDKTSQNSMFNPQATLLEILDPEQNTTFKDHYLNTPFDLSNAIFICTANDTSTIDRPLLDRMEVIDLAGYTVEEKVAISRSHLLPKQRRLHALEKEEADVKPILDLTEEALEALVTRWTAESGVRSLERQLAQICRWAALRLQGVDVPTGLGREAAREAALSNSGPDVEGRIKVNAEHLPHILGVELFEPNLAERLDVGVSMGLSVSSVGGQLLFIEATKTVGSGKLTVTGQLGKVMMESVETALSLLRSRFVRLSQSSPHVFNFETERMELSPGAVDEKDPFKGEDIHVHFPAGGIPKDGPSAGVAVLLALASLVLNRPVRSDTAVTGEVTLRGHVLPVGGIRDKVLAAIRGGVKHVLLPMANERHVHEDIPAKSLDGVEIHYLKTVDEALDWVFGSTFQATSGVSANEATEGSVAPFSMRSRL